MRDREFLDTAGHCQVDELFVNLTMPPEHLGPDGTISTQAPGVMSRASPTRRGERTAVSQDLVRDCDQAMRSLDAPAT